MNFTQSLLHSISDILMISDLSLSVAEDVSGGSLQFFFSQMLNASLIYKGGITAYTTEEKVLILDVGDKKIKESKGVSEEISEQLAKGVLRLFNSDLSISSIGYSSISRDSGYGIFCIFLFVLKVKFSLLKNFHCILKQSH